MKFLAVLGVLVIQCAATKSWNNDSYSEEAFSVFGWIGYLKRLSLMVLMFSGVVLYYVPESRPHARRICYALIDLTANGLKSALSARESEYMYEKIKSKYHRAKYEQSLVAQKRQSRENQEDGENFECAQNRSKKTKALIDDDELLGGREKKKVSGKQSKEHRQPRHRLRNGIIKDSSCMEISKPIYFYSDKLDDLQKYVKSNLNGVKRGNGTTVENYALLISGSPQQMAMLDQKYEKDDVVIVQDPYLRLEYKECGTSTDKLSSKGDASGSEQEGPTRDHNDHATDSGMETYVKDVDLYSIPEGSVPRYSDYTALYQTSQYQCGGECCGGNGCSVSSGDLNNNRESVNSVPPADIKNVLKSSRSMVTPKTHKKIEEGTESLYDVNYNKHERRALKSSHDRKVDFRKEDKEAAQSFYVDQKHEETVRQRENTTRCVRWKTPRNEEPLTGFCSNNISYFTDRGGEADDENSQHGVRVTAKHDLDERPQRENYVSIENSDHSIFDYDFEDFCARPILKNRFKPALLRAVNWIFGGCPEASRVAGMKRNEVGKEEIRGLADEWLL